MKRFLPLALIGLIAILGLAFGMRAMRSRREAEGSFEEMVSQGVS